jgi:hypothetical protein
LLSDLIVRFVSFTNKTCVRNELSDFQIVLCDTTRLLLDRLMTMQRHGNRYSKLCV